MSSNGDKILLTLQGYEALKKEYRELLEVKRPKIVERLADSRQAGDLAENSEYSQAKEELSFIDGRIGELEEVLKKAVVINNTHKSCPQVDLGCKVTVENSQGTHVFWIVGEWEANPTQKKISYTSPLGKSLLGKKVGDKVEVEIPAGKIVYTILKIE
ncbi:MAG: transcription elongation factor GreA [Microgenomates group bacterium]